MGRPSEYDEEKAAHICQRISTSSDGLRKICREVGIDPGTHFRWLSVHEEYYKRYARAREQQLEVLAAEIVDISNQTKAGRIKTVRTGKNGGTEVRTLDLLEHRRLQIDARKWVLSKLAPHKYGEKQQLVGADGGDIRVLVEHIGSSNQAPAEAK